MALRARTTHLRATACNFKILEATFNSYFFNFRKARLICHLLGLFPREVIKHGNIFGYIYSFGSLCSPVAFATAPVSARQDQLGRGLNRDYWTVNARRLWRKPLPAGQACRIPSNLTPYICARCSVIKSI